MSNFPTEKNLEFTNVQERRSSGMTLGKLPVLGYTTYDCAFARGTVEEKTLGRENIGFEAWNVGVFTLLTVDRGESYEVYLKSLSLRIAMSTPSSVQISLYMG